MTFYDIGNTNAQSRAGQCWRINGKFIILRTKFDIIHTEDQIGELCTGLLQICSRVPLQRMHSAFM